MRQLDDPILVEFQFGDCECLSLYPKRLELQAKQYITNWNTSCSQLIFERFKYIIKVKSDQNKSLK